MWDSPARASEDAIGPGRDRQGMPVVSRQTHVAQAPAIFRIEEADAILVQDRDFLSVGSKQETARPACISRHGEGELLGSGGNVPDVHLLFAGTPKRFRDRQGLRVVQIANATEGVGVTK